MQLHRELGISYDASWRIKHKLMQVMMERDDRHQLAGLVQLDYAYLGCERSVGKHGRGAVAETSFLAAVQTNDKEHPIRIKLSLVKGFRCQPIAAWAKRHLALTAREGLFPRTAQFQCPEQGEFRASGDHHLRRSQCSEA